MAIMQTKSLFIHNNRFLLSPVLGATNLLIFQLLASLALFESDLSIQGLILVFAATFINYFMVDSKINRIIYVIAVYLYSPLITMPVEKLPLVLGEVFTFLLQSDRLGVAIISKIALMLALLISILRNRSLWIKYPLNISLLLIICASFVGIIKWYSSDNFSLVLAINDISQYVTTLCVCVLIGDQTEQENKALVDGLVKVMQLFVVIILVEFVVTLSNVFPWSYSYRDTLRGVLTNSEVAFNFRLGVAAIFAYLFYNRASVKALLTIPLLVGMFLYGENTTCAAAVVLIFLIVHFIRHFRNYGYLIRGIKIKIIMLILLICVVGLFLYSRDMEKQVSFMSRFGTVLAGYIAFSDNYFFGLGPGVMDLSQLTNVAYNIFQYDFRFFLLSFSQEVGASGLIERYEYNDPLLGAFNPHILLFLILYSLGLFSIPFIYLFYKQLLKSISSNYRSLDNNKVVISCILLYIFIVSLMHPIFLPVETVFCILCLQPFHIHYLDNHKWKG